MAAVTGAVQSVFNFNTPVGHRATSAGATDMACVVTLTFSGTYAGADDATVTKSVIATAIQNARRDGKTVTVDQICAVGPGSEAGALVFASFPTLSGSTFTTQLLQADKSTEHANAALGTWDYGIPFVVNFRLS